VNPTRFQQGLVLLTVPSASRPDRTLESAGVAKEPQEPKKKFQVLASADGFTVPDDLRRDRTVTSIALSQASEKAVREVSRRANQRPSLTSFPGSCKLLRWGQAELSRRRPLCLQEGIFQMVNAW